MKRCSYCGAEYPDDAIECIVDKTPFAEVQPELDCFRRPTFALISEHQIPVSLIILSYLFFLPGAVSFGFAILLLTLFVLLGGPTISGYTVLGCAFGFANGIFWLLLSRGLRRGSRGWRTCALFFIWWGFIATAYGIGQYLLTHKTPDHETATAFLLECAFALVWQAWQYRVLTRPDIRDLFYGSTVAT